jgi:hypothetical protein
MKVTFTPQYPERYGTGGNAQRMTQQRGSSRPSEPTAPQESARSRVIVKQEKFADVYSSAQSTQRPTRINREGDAQALFVYDSLANYDPSQPRPSVDVYI